MRVNDVEARHLARGHIARRRGALSGLLVVVLGAWGALIPFIGSSFDYGYTPDDTWDWTKARGWLEVLPGSVAVVAGVMMLLSVTRVTALASAWLAAAAGAWFVVGPTLAPVLHTGDLGAPISDRPGIRALETIGLFTGLGAVLIFIAAMALGRLSIRTDADVRSARRRLNNEAAAARDAALAEPVVEEPAVVTVNDEESRRHKAENDGADNEIDGVRTVHTERL